MNSYSTLFEAWGTESLETKKRKKKKRRKKEIDNDTYYMDEPIDSDNEIQQLQKKRRKSKTRKKTRNNKAYYMRRPKIRKSNRNIEPIKIQLDDDELDYEGYNSSDYEQYELNDTTNVSTNVPTNVSRKRNTYNDKCENDNSVMMESNDNDYYSNEFIYQEEEPQYNNNSSCSQLDGATIQRLYSILDRLEMNENCGENMYDVLLFIFFGVFILFIIDYMYKIGVKTSLSL